MCVAGLPVAALPLWQLVQLVAAVNVLWSVLAPAQVAGALVAALAAAGHGGVGGSGWLAHRAEVAAAGAQRVAGDAAGAHADVAVHAAVGPGGEAALVAAVALGRRGGRHRRIGHVVGRLAVGRRKAAAVAAVARAATATCVWFHLVGFQPAGLTLWQLKHCVAPVGTWVDGLPLAALPLWQLAQLVAALKVAWSTLAPLQLLVPVWQFSQLVTPLCTACAGLAHRAHEAAGVAAGAAAGDREVGMEAAVAPGGEAALVAAVAVGGGRRRDRRVGHVVRRPAVGGRKAAVVTGGALAGHHRLRVVPRGGPPTREGLVAVVARLIGAGRHVARGLAGRLAGAMAAGAGAGHHADVIELGGRDPAARAVAAVARRSGLDVVGRFAVGGGAVVAALAGAGRHALVVEAGADEGPACCGRWRRPATWARDWPGVTTLPRE